MVYRGSATSGGLPQLRTQVGIWSTRETMRSVLHRHCDANSICTVALYRPLAAWHENGQSGGQLQSLDVQQSKNWMKNYIVYECLSSIKEISARGLYIEPEMQIHLGWANFLTILYKM